MRASQQFRRGAAAFAVCTAILLAGCSDDTTTAPKTLSSIAVSPATATLAVAATQALTVTGTYSDATTEVLTTGVTFTTSAAGVATVSAAGLVTAVAGGSATITATASGRTATSVITVTAPAPSGSGVVFSDDYVGVSFADFGGATNAVSIDATTLYNGRKSIRAIIPTTNYSGGAFVSAAPRNLSAFNAVTFYARASVAKSTLNVGIGNNAATNVLNAESLDLALTTNWVKYIVPLPNPAKMVDYNGLFHFADGPENYTVWFADIQYENLPASQVAAPTGGTAAWPTATVAIGTPYQMAPNPNTVIFTTPVLPNGGRLTDVAWRWFNLTSSNPAVATVSPDGLITALSAGTTTVSATIGGIAIPGSSTFTVSAPLAVPTTIAAAPTRPAADVISLFTTVYTNRTVDTWRTSWSEGGNTLTDPFVIGTRNVKRYSLFNFAGIEFTSSPIDATAMTHLHVDIWTPNPSSNLTIELVNGAGAPGTAIGRYQAGALASGSWVSLDIPLASFTGLSARSVLNQMLFVAAGPTVIYIDNVYLYR